MISALASGVPLTAAGSLVFAYEEGHRRFALSCLNRDQKLDTSMLDDREAAHVAASLERVGRRLAYEHRQGTPKAMTAAVYVCVLLGFAGLVALLVLSDEFLDVVPSDLALVGLVAGLALLSALAVGAASYRYYRHLIGFLQEQSVEIQSIVDSLNLRRDFGFEWEMGEYGLWIRVKRDDLQWSNEFPDETNDEPEDNVAEDVCGDDFMK